MKFDIDKIVNYLVKYKSELPNLYTWNAKIDRLLELETLTKEQIKEINASRNNYEKELRLKEVVGNKLKELYETKDSNPGPFDKLCLWIIKDWGGITASSDTDTLKSLKVWIDQKKPSFNRIASFSKVGAYLRPQENVIYDSRVAYSLNWIILSENAGERYFPIPEGRNSRMSAFDMNVLIRLKHISNYYTENDSLAKHKFFISNTDKKIFINKNDAYTELNILVKDISKKLWNGEEEKQQNLYFTEMLLFSIADREVFKEITERFSQVSNTENTKKGKAEKWKLDQMWNGYCPESWLKGKKVRMRLNRNDFFESEETGLQIAVLKGVQAIILNFRGNGNFSSTVSYADEIENGELLSPQNTDLPPFNRPTDVFQNSNEIESYIKGIN